MGGRSYIYGELMLPTTLKSQLKEIVAKLAVVRAKPGELFTLASGKQSDFYIDCRRVTLSPDGLYIVSDCLHYELFESPLDFTAIGGPTLGADPIVAGLLMRAAKERGPNRRSAHGFLVRKEAKEHGLQHQIEGHLVSGDRAVLVEDVVTSGASLEKAIAAVEQAGAEVVRIVAILDRLEGAAEKFRHRGYDFSSLLTSADLGL